MRKIYKSSLMIISFLYFQSANSQTVDPQYEIGTWHGFCNAAVSFTFDDGTPKQFTTAVPLFNEFGFNLTLYIVTRSAGMGLPNWNTLQQAADNGHEIGAHTLTHTSFADLSDSLEMVELRDCRQDIDSHITGHRCVTMACPYCVTGNKTICASYYIGARICSGQIEPSTPRDFMAISSIVCGTEGSVKTSDHFISRASSAIKSKGWCVYLLHGVDNDGGWSPVTSDVLRETLQHLHENRNDYWVDSFGNVVRYIEERNAVSVTEISMQDSSIIIQVTDSLDNEIFNYPISIRRSMPENWAAGTVTQDGEPVDTKMVDENGIRYVQFDAIPDNGDVVIWRTNDTYIQNPGTMPFNHSLRQNYPNPFNPQTTIQYTVPFAEHVSIKLYNLRGELVKTLVDQNQPAGTFTVSLDGSGLSAGIYLYQMRTGSFEQTKRFVYVK
ncbi:polysaccharide deacetylase family protein [candidate division KSB1 bacterium]|nr:polysaccharide deacetylase family protein [candidate division KSB1 bacterium]